MELVITISVMAVLSASLVAVFLPQINLFFYLPQQIHLQNAAWDLMEVIRNGDSFSKGIRFAHPIGPSPSVISASSNRLSYWSIVPDDACPYYLTILTYDDVNGAIGRTVYKHSYNYGTSSYSLCSFTDPPFPPSIPGDISIQSLNGDGVFFKYYDAGSLEWDGSDPAQIYRVDVAFRILPSGASSGGVPIKSGVEIKHYE